MGAAARKEKREFWREGSPSEDQGAVRPGEKRVDVPVDDLATVKATTRP